MEKDGMNKPEREHVYLYWLLQLPAMGAVTAGHLLNRFGSFAAVYNMEGTRLCREGLLKPSQAAAFEKHKERLAAAARQYETLSRRGIRFVSILDPEYPSRLRHLYDPPAALYVRGGLPEDGRPTAAVIGARSCSSYGYQTARMLGRELAAAGIQIISGMALGIDGAGHQGALDAGCRTYAVLGSGVDICYPKENRHLYSRIPKQGGLLSEFAPGQPPKPGNFPMRNRIISGLSDAIVVVEARAKSGSLITVELGLEQGKEIFAVPGRMGDALSEGCHQLIRQGAALLSSPADVLDYFQINGGEKLRLHEKNENGLAKKEKMVYSCLDLQPKFFDQIVEESGLSLEECMTLLMELELKGRIRQPAAHYYEKKM